MKEIWKDIEGFEGRYSVSNYGRIRQNKIEYISLQNKLIKHEEKILEPITWQSRYLRIDLISNKKNNKRRLNTYIHKLVAEYFIGPRPEGYEIDHIDRDYLNNRADNLRYVDHKENINNINKEKWLESIHNYWENRTEEEKLKHKLKTKEGMKRPEVQNKLGSGTRNKHRIYDNIERTKYHFD